MKYRQLNSKDIFKSKRFDGSFHNADVNVYDSVITRHSLHHLSYYCSEIFTSGRNKRVYTTPEFGDPFLSNSDASSASPFTTCKYSSKKYGFDEKAILKGGMILTGRVGAIGQTVFVPKYWENFRTQGSDNIIRIVVKPQFRNGFIYAYLASRIGNLSFWRHATGGVQPFITDKMVGELPIPEFPDTFQQEVDDLIQESARLREEAADMLSEADRLLKKEAGLRDLVPEDYDYYGPRNAERKVSCFTIKRKDITTTTINAFNLSERIRKTKASITCTTKPLREVLLGGETFSSTSVPSIEVKPEHGVMFINQKDIFDNIIKGKWVSKRNVSLDRLVEYGEVIVACDGTLGENELFCRALFANEDLSGALISTHFIRMKSDGVPSGYLYTWLNSDYGFRFIRNCQAGTKLCHPIPKMFLEIPVPIISEESMNQIDTMVKNAYTKRYEANNCERKAIRMVEQEIEKWNKH
ncbi:methylation-associated defense system restriction endonuclease subunit S MAD5 [Prevotella sp.]|uniref:methylation-associated defense system restriction endonuclease subunit S MAD5 n=1 Tax=Prevotella sp. TaxID=59823 RepID=UPI002E7678C7|nr:restriction endonuclease subunit S [Prevotella sp.]MEE0671617.1 restriction endonuclease subunit S [Prevotella sp.]